MIFRLLPAALALAMLLLTNGAAVAEVLAGPGDLRIRHDVDLLNDLGVINITSTAWPISWFHDPLYISRERKRTPQ